MNRNLVDPDLERGIWLLVMMFKLFFVVVLLGIGAAVYERIKRE